VTKQRDRQNRKTEKITGKLNMSTTPRINSAVPGQPATFATVLGHTPLTAQRFGALYAEFWQHGVSPVAIREMTRLRNARITDCGF
jgi:hypothetical protein